MKHGKEIKLSPEIEAEIKRMARADFRSYEDELQHLMHRGLTVPKNHSVGEDARMIAELAYLREEQVDESREESIPREKPRRVLTAKLNRMWYFLRTLGKREKHGS